ncbi:tryptophan-rich sensory protein [Actinoalloteichus sp. AHMU CJ021]|uniref:TspO and MBR related proteins n=1 Tax=Actinoalloteichus caeruleus DSM 43889 TaxID=1120930 RepID=A0ABT1JP50_ACTCY|nr:TspO/MBR family protein [Actinoalloteichus caeruleus]AUS79868.1 tryptophan-rich sensory protein [Actinoalloteichus sp. AHMU CJ021]MCP2334039.1 TspO and MBR related proteins [Actinoalloteichus caeruleus DSM 43889]
MPVQPEPGHAPAHPVRGLLVFVAAVAATAVVGSLASRSAAEDYAALELPSWAPPSWLFGPVWTALYVLIAVSGWLVWRRHGITGARTALGLYGAQLVLNAAWTPLFFAAGRYGLALVDIVVLFLVVAVLVGLFARLHRTAAVLLVPYLLWVGFAALLNAAVWSLNT